MSPTKKDQIYNLRVVVHKTGIKPDTLRAWERRYGLPKPDRTAGGHRLYSDYDIEMIRWLIARQDEGLRINRAVELWKSLEEEQIQEIPVASDDAIEDSHYSASIAGSSMDGLRKEWIQACLEFDERVAENILAQSFARYPLESVCLELLQKGLSDIGSLWFSGKATVQQEHFASALTLRKMNSLIAASPAPSRSDTLLVACAPQEEHVFAPMLISLFLRYRGWNVVYLGADVPLVDLEKALDLTNAELVIMNATMLYTAANLYEAGKYLLSRNKVFAFGGNIFTQNPALRQHIPGFFLGEQLDNVVISVEKLFTSDLSQPKYELIQKDYLSAARHWKENQLHIEVYVREDLIRNGFDMGNYQIANEYLGKNILASLTLGNIEYLIPEINWVYALIKNHALSLELLPKYLRAYADAASEYLPEYGYIIADFLYAESKRLASIQ